MSALTLTQHREPDPERMAALRARCAGAGEPGFLGCGHCRACRRDRARALARPDCDRPYLGPVPLPARPVEGPALWLVNHWPMTRQRTRAAMLAEVTGEPLREPPAVAKIRRPGKSRASTTGPASVRARQVSLEPEG